MRSENDNIAGLENAEVDLAVLRYALPSSGRLPLRDGKENGSLQSGNRAEKLKSAELQEIVAAVI
jgi:hypothetical protein